MQTSRIAVSVGTALLLAASAGIASATTISSAFLSPTLPAGYTAINLGSIGVPFNTPISGPGYGVTFAVNDPLQGVVNGAGSLPHAVPVGGANGSQPLYLTGGFGSPLTSDIGQSGNYFSTGTGAITITFDQPQYWLVLLWGSIDVENQEFPQNSSALPAQGQLQLLAGGWHLRRTECAVGENSSDFIGHRLETADR